MTKATSFLSRRPLIVPAALAALMLVGTAGPRPRGYFTLLRWVVGAAAVAFAASGGSTGRVWAGWLFGVLAALFNPVVPVHLARTTWRPIDAAAGVAFAVGAIRLTTAPATRDRPPIREPIEPVAGHGPGHSRRSDAP
jgi:hypothetical protein